MAKHCFVIMPFKQHGTPEYAHFRALFDNVLKPTIEAFGYGVTRADDAKRVGSITKDIIVPLAQADLVVADLTEVNPNVFYELGVRHALRGFGTIMIMDETQNAIPFDITAYRVLKFRSTLEGIGALGRELSQYIQQMEQDPGAGIKDNLVHDWLPSLPANVLESSLGSEEGALRRQIQELRRSIKAYEEKYGAISTLRDEGPGAIQVVMDALQEAKSGQVAATLVEKANAAAARGEATEYLTSLSSIMQLRTSRPSTRHVVELMHAATILGLDAVSEALIEHAQKWYPNNRELRFVRFSTFAHSANPASRARARQGMLEELGIDLTADSCVLRRAWNEDVYFSVLGVMLDAFHEDDLHGDALRILEAAIEQYPESAIVVRNYARALEHIGKVPESFEYHRRSLFLPDSDDTAAIWFGNELHNRGRHVDAAEVYLIACLKDPNDARGFVQFADEVGLAQVRQSFQGQSVGRELPKPVGDGKATIAAALVAAFGMGALDPEMVQRARGAAKRAEIDIEDLDQHLQGQPPPLSRVERVGFARAQMEIFRSALTDPAADVSQVKGLSGYLGSAA